MVFYLGEPLNDPPPKPEKTDGSERRQHKRRFIHFAVRYRFNAEGVLSDWKTSEAGNISAGGLFMTFGENLHMGKQMDVEFLVPGQDKVIKATGTIRWLKVVVPDTMVECGLEFSNISAEDQAFIKNFAEEEDKKAEGNNPPAPPPQNPPQPK